KYPTYKDVNETAERLGGVLNAYTSHDLVAFHLTVRAESAGPAIDLLSDFVGRPRLDAEELDRERGVIIQEINRAYDQPSTVAEYLIDRAAFGEHPLGRTVLGPEENLRSFMREGIVAFRERRWAGARGGAFLVGNLDHLPAPEVVQECFARFPALPAPEHAYADVPILQLGSGLESSKTIEAYTLMREIVDELREQGPSEEEVTRARAYAAGRRVLAFEHTGAVASYAANQTIVLGDSI